MLYHRTLVGRQVPGRPRRSNDYTQLCKHAAREGGCWPAWMNPMRVWPASLV